MTAPSTLQANETPKTVAPNRALEHGVALGLFALAAGFTVHFLRSNAALFHVFPSLALPHALGEGSLELDVLLWTAGALAILLVLGWFLLECFELYLPIGAALALAFACGLGLAGFLYEALAIAGPFLRPWIFALPGGALLATWPLAFWSARRRPETGEGGDGGAAEQAMRRALARRQYRRTLVRPTTPAARLFSIGARALIALVTLLAFHHALLYPETNWEALADHLEFARRLYFENRMPSKVAMQSGMASIAHHPHAVSLVGGAIAVAAERWSELPMRAIPPVAGLAALVLVYQTALRLTRHVNFALAIALIYRATPMTIAYDQLALDRAAAALFTAAFLYLALLYLDTALRGYLALATLVVAFAATVSYEMAWLGLGWALTVAAAHCAQPDPASEIDAERDREMTRAMRDTLALEPGEDEEDRAPPWTCHPRREGLWALLHRPSVFVSILLGGAIAALWPARNWIVTGNPIFPHLPRWLDGIGASEAVLASMMQARIAMGDGIGLAGADAATRAARAWDYFAFGPGSFRWQPLLMGFAGGGALALIASGASALWSRRARGDLHLRFGWIALTLVAALMALHVAAAPADASFLIPAAPAMAVVAAFGFRYWRLPGWKWAWGGLALIVGVVPGLAVGLTGFKGANDLSRRRLAPHWETDLATFRLPLPSTDRIYAQAYDETPEIWRWMNERLIDARVLTHEDRAYVFNPTIELVPLDDWEVRAIWSRPPEEAVAALIERGIEHYLKSPHESLHSLDAYVDGDAWIERGLATPEASAGAFTLYRLHPPPRRP